MKEQVEASMGDILLDSGGVILGLKLVTKVSPNLLTWIEDTTFGKKILIVGQARSGKTSFLNYMQHAMFADDEHGEPRTVQTENSGSMRLKLGPRKTLELKVKNITDTVGQAPEQKHAIDVKKTKADAILVFVSAETPLSDHPDSCYDYLTELFEHLAEMARATPAFAKKARTVIVVQNKVDLVEAKEGVDRRSKLNAHVKPLISNVFGKAVSYRSGAMSCSLIEDFDQGKLALKVVEKIAKNLVG